MGLHGATETTTEEGGDPCFCGSEGFYPDPDPDPSFEKISDPAKCSPNKILILFFRHESRNNRYFITVLSL